MPGAVAEKTLSHLPAFGSWNLQSRLLSTDIIPGRFTAVVFSSSVLSIKGTFKKYIVVILSERTCMRTTGV